MVNSGDEAGGSINDFVGTPARFSRGAAGGHRFVRPSATGAIRQAERMDNPVV
jgi:hypothetical protein